ncbi:hypothetical protein EYZ11_003839 [Aspergillus tanneri]|uniref:Secreted protein n=1 Tax=Aspergillus tanneri TaxID=1220188 RepID=A0A4V3UPW4_9EURO|nr:uncharacterized protein ATNIH1004_002926 [Aspergillus tanneri]KAA8650244.1 hypothetical protein ATNIH1004_002926 [Aspergillus tanneri]THC96684.1 hypothetical protein EYZ11_003839 [Aspergillus tanneri]
MLFRASVLCMAASIVSVPLAAALPTTTTTTDRVHSGPTLISRDDTQCNANTAFYVCKLNNFRGCCSVDPCDLKDGCPDDNDNDNDNNDSSRPTTCTEKGKKTKLFQPQMQTLILPNTDHPISTPDFNLSKSDTGEWQQIISWSLPSEAKDCSIGWSIPEKRNFSAGHSALVGVYDVDDNDEKKSLGHADFSFWPETKGPRTSLVASIQCKKVLTLRLALVHKDRVFLEQNGETGWWVEYSC